MPQPQRPWRWKAAGPGLILALVLGSGNAPIQLLGQTPPKNKIEIYSTALVETLKEMEKQWGHFKNAPADYKHIVVYKSDSVEADYPAKADAREFEFLNYAQLLARRKATKKDFPVFIVHAAMIDGSRLKVTVTRHWISISKRRLNLGVSDWGEVFFRFDCEQAGFVLDEVKLGGI